MPISMPSVLLSICIPTYQRAKFLERLLEHIVQDVRFPFAYEIVVSDNASIDGTAELVERYRVGGLPINYVRQDQTVDAYRNWGNAFCLARGTYLIYIADDDLLIPDRVLETLAYMDRNPQVGVVFAPWEYYDDVDKCRLHDSCELESVHTYSKQDFIALFEFVAIKGFQPEIAIYRTNLLQRLLVPTRHCFLPTALLADFLRVGDIAIMPQPFYRFVLRTEIPRTRQNEGHRLSQHEWDFYRGGIEYMVYAGLARSGIEITENQRSSLVTYINLYYLQRLIVALTLWLKEGLFLDAYYLYCRCAINVKLYPVDNLKKRLIDLKPDIKKVCAAAVMEMAARDPNVGRVGILGIVDTESWVADLQEAGGNINDSDLVVEIVVPDRVVIDGYLFVVSSGEIRHHMIHIGVAPGRVIALNELLSQFSLPLLDFREGK